MFSLCSRAVWGSLHQKNSLYALSQYQTLAAVSSSRAALPSLPPDEQLPSCPPPLSDRLPAAATRLPVQQSLVAITPYTLHRIYQHQMETNVKILAQDSRSSRLSCTSSEDITRSTQEEKKPNLERVAYLLLYDLTNVFIRKIDWQIYHPNIIFEDRIRGKTYEGLLEYIKFVNLVRIFAHFKFVYVRFHVLSLTKHPEDGTIRVRWRIAGLGVIRMVLRYIPDKMWIRGNMDKASPSWYDGYSVFYVDSNDKIVRHVADKMMPDEDKASVKDQVVEKLKKLKPVTAPSPVV